MRKLKKWSCLLLALLMLPALAACGKKQQPDSNASQNEVQDTDTPQDSTPTEEQTKVLVVYFSATGSTKAVAGYIAETLGADTFELTPQEPYLAADLDYNNSESRVCREHADPALQDVAGPHLYRCGELGTIRHGVCGLSHLVGRQRMACQRICEGK